MKVRSGLARAFAGGHLPKQYDWRDDPKYNPDITYNPRNFDWHPEKYVTPYMSEPDPWIFPVTKFDNTDVSLNACPENRKIALKNLMSVG